MIYIATYIRKLKDRSGNYITPATRSKGVYFSSNKTLDDLVFPVGFIYQSTSSTSPASLYGGSWERIQGRFLLGTSSSYSVSSTGGEEKHQLSEAESCHHAHELYIDDEEAVDHSSPNTVLKSPTYGWSNHYREVGQAISFKGSDQPHNNMPPYYAVNIWRRTA